MAGFYYQPDPTLAKSRPDVYISMGNTAENVASAYSVTREDQDLFAYNSHMKAVKAIQEGRFQDEITGFPISTETLANGGSDALIVSDIDGDGDNDVIFDDDLTSNIKIWANDF